LLHPTPQCPNPQGFETTSHAISWTLGLLAAHPEAQGALAAELAALGLAPRDDAPEPRRFEWGDLSRLPLLNATLKESLRLFPPASGDPLRSPPAAALWGRVPVDTGFAPPPLTIRRSPTAAPPVRPPFDSRIHPLL
jgi:cytochrome P450